MLKQSQCVLISSFVSDLSGKYNWVSYGFFVITFNPFYTGTGVMSAYSYCLIFSLSEKTAIHYAVSPATVYVGMDLFFLALT